MSGPSLGVSLRHISLGALIGSCLGAAALRAEPLPAGLPDAAAPGSHALFLEYAEGAEQRTLDALVRRYDAYVAAHPADITAHLERARFLEQAGCHEDEECPYWDEYERSLGQLRQRFSGNAEVELYLLGELWGDDGVARAKELLDAAEGWDAAQRARLHARLIELADSDDAAEILEHFRSASALDPALDLTLEGARALVALHRPQEAIRTLTSQLEAGEPPRKLEKIRLLADLEAYREADEALASLPSSDEHRLLQAKLWLGLGRVDDARRALAEARAASTWDGQTLDIEARQFELELRHGDEASASAAYAALRNGGFRRDPLLKQRVRLALRFPTLGWQLRDLLGALALLGFFAVCALAPLLVLLPIHYAGLVRGAARPMPEPASWELRHAWCALALLGAAHLPFLYVEGVAERLLTWLTSRALFLRTYAVEEAPLASASLLTLAILLAGSTLLLVRCGRFPFGRGSWSAGKTLGSALVALLGFRLFAAAWVSALPDSLFASHAPAASTVSDLAQAMARAYGAPSVWGFLAVGIPIVEELIFRSVLLDSFRRHLPSLWANLAQAALFGVLHEPWGMVPVFIAFGAAAGRLAERSGSLRAGLIMHAGNNALECTALAL